MPTILRAKLVIVGDSTVGKSAITQVFHSDGTHFPKNYTMTCGVELCVKSVTVPEANTSVELYIYDSAGKEIFSDLVQKHWTHPNMIMVVFDVTNETSFNSCAKWLERVRSQKPDILRPAVLVGNKTDLEERRVISTKLGENFAHANGLEYFECSAREMQGIDKPFLYLSETYHKLFKERTDHFAGLA